MLVSGGKRKSRRAVSKKSSKGASARRYVQGVSGGKKSKMASKSKKAPKAKKAPKSKKSKKSRR